MADLGFSHSYFSCQKYHESDHVSITKVVVLFTMIFYTFCKFLQTGYTIEDSFRTEAPGKNQTLADRSLVHGFNPGKISIVTNLPFRRRVGSPAAMAGRP
jgi:hypothetical protein